MDIKTLKMLENTTVLIVEDDEMVLLGLTQALEPYCKKIYSAQDGEKGLEAYRKNIVNVVITDINMPELNGFEMIREILKIKPTQEFIIITSYDSDENLITSIEEGAYSFLRKPLSIEDLQTQLLILAKKSFQKVTQLSSELVVEPTKDRILKNDQELILSPSAERIFWLLFHNLNHVVKYDVIAYHAFDSFETNKNAIRIAVSRLAEIIGKELIENVSGVGYKLKGASHNTPS